MDKFYPNKITNKDIPNLHDWQVFVAAIHHSPSMGDARSFDYGYSYKDGHIYCHTQSGEICLDGDIDLNNPWDAIQNYFFHRNHKKFCIDSLKSALSTD